MVNLVTIKITRTHFADRAFRCCAPSVWNSIDSEKLLCSSISGFKRSLKTLLFRQAFSSTTWTVRQRLWSHPTCWRYTNKIIIIIIIIKDNKQKQCRIRKECTKKTKVLGQCNLREANNCRTVTLHAPIWRLTGQWRDVNRWINQWTNQPNN